MYIIISKNIFINLSITIIYKNIFIYLSNKHLHYLFVTCYLIINYNPLTKRLIFIKLIYNFIFIINIIKNNIYMNIL